MKKHPSPQRFPHPNRGWWVGVLSFAMATSLISAALGADSGASSFVAGLPGEEVLDTTVDSLGTTYVLGRDASNHTVLTKYDSSGAQLAWYGDGAMTRTVTDIDPVAFCVKSVTTPGATNLLYIAGTTNIVRLNADTGQGAVELSLPTGVPLNLNAIYCAGDDVFLSGTYSGTSSTTIFGKTAHARGTQAAILIKLDSNLSSTALALSTFGCSGGGNTAESLVADEAGDVYVAGHFANGILDLDGSVTNNGQWKVDVVYSSSSVGDLDTAGAVLFEGSNATKTNTDYFNIINFGGGNDGAYGNDAAFPGGGGEDFVLHATGEIWIASPGKYYFASATDDGTQVVVDGFRIIYYKGTVFNKASYNFAYNALRWSTAVASARFSRME